MSGVITKGRFSLPVLRQQFAKVDGPQFREDLSRVCGEAAAKMVSDEFRRGVDPYGTPWEPLRSRRGQPLLLTGRLRASFAVQVVPNGFRIDATAVYAKYHQYGTKPHARLARTAKQNARGRFVRRNKAGYLLRIRAHQNGGIPARPMVPTPEQGGLPYKWQRKFRQEAVDLVRRSMTP